MREAFVTTSKRGLLHDSPPMRLYHKAKRFFWDPRSIDLSRDREVWQELGGLQQDALLRLVSIFQAGEEAVTLDLLPLIMTIAKEGRIEEEMYLTTFLLDEAKHVEFFRRFLDEVVGNPGDLHRYHTPSYKKIFYEELPKAMNRLLTDPSPAAQAEAAATYNLVVEGVLAETGYYAFYTAMRQSGTELPGVLEGIRNIQRDESRHIGYGVFLLSRLVAEDRAIWPVIERRLNELLPYALGVVNEFFAAYPDGLPFGLDLQLFLEYAMRQFRARMARVEQAQHRTLAEVYKLSSKDLEADEEAT